MVITYGKDWSRIRGEMTEIWDESRARAAHIARIPYAVFVQTDELPNYFIILRGDNAVVGFLDHLGREYLTHQFNEKKSERLFLSIVYYNEFKVESSDPEVYFLQFTRRTITIFQTNGMYVVEEQDWINQTKTTHTAKEPIDVSINWEPYPKFGYYASIARTSREC